MILYIDPGSGSFLLQALLAAIAGAWVTLRWRWQWLRQRLGLGGDRKPDSPGEPPPADD